MFSFCIHLYCTRFFQYYGKPKQTDYFHWFGMEIRNLHQLFLDDVISWNIPQAAGISQTSTASVCAHKVHPYPKCTLLLGVYEQSKLKIHWASLKVTMYAVDLCCCATMIQTLCAWMSSSVSVLSTRLMSSVCINCLGMVWSKIPVCHTVWDRAQLS